MATAREDEGPVCPICVESFTIPKVLSCGHSCCLDCLKIYVADDVKHFLCAECRQQIDVPDDGLKAFPTNYALVKSAPVVTSKCQNHAKKDAECYCRKCQSVLCYKCLHLHHNDHDSFDLESDQVTVNEEFSKYEDDIRESIHKLTIISKTKAFIRHKCGEIREFVENAEMELDSVLFSTSNESFLTLVQNLPKLQQLDTKLKEEYISLSKVEVETEDGGYWQMESSGDDDEKPDVQFSFNFGFDPKAWIYEMEHYSKDKFCVTALRKLVWSCSMVFLGNGFCAVYVILLGEENKDIDHCVIDYRLSLSHQDSGEEFVIKQERDARFDTGVSHGFRDFDIWPEDTNEIIFDIIRVKEIVNKV